MDTTSPFLMDDEVFNKLLRAFVAECERRLRMRNGWHDCGSAVLAFRRWMRSQGLLDADHAAIRLWMEERSQTLSSGYVSRQTRRLGEFCQYMVKRRLLCSNPVQILRDRHQGASVSCMAKAIKGAKSLDALEGPADRPLSGALKKPFLDYLNYLAALGYRAEAPRLILTAFERHLRGRNVRHWKYVTRERVEDWQRCMGPAKGYLVRYRLVVLGGFFDFLAGQGVIQHSPLPPPPMCRRRSEAPHVLSRDEVRRVLDAAGRLLDSREFPYRGPTYRIVYLLLYALGLRISEALNLKIRDIEFVEDSLTIVKTKFNKGRVLPFGPRLKAALKEYLENSPLLKVSDGDSPVFPAIRHGSCRLHRHSCRHTLQGILKELHISTASGTRPPCLHSFRHSFAVHRVERWLSEGADLGVKLTLLSAFMGHVDIAATQLYLSMTPERLRLINDCFEQACGKED